MVILNYINRLFRKELPRAKELYLNHDKSGIEQLQILTDRLDKLDTLRKKHDDFVSAIIEVTDPELLKKDKYGHFLFLEKDDAINILKKVIAKVMEE